MSGPKRNADTLNTIGIVVVGICGAVLVYVTIVALQAFYVNDSSEVQTTADYGGQDTGSRSLRAAQVGAITAYATNPRPAAAKAGEAEKPQTYHMPIDLAMRKVVDEAKADQSSLIPTVGRSDKATVLPIFGRPKLIQAPPVPAPAAPAAPAAGTGSGSAAADTGSGSAAAPAAGTGSGSAVDVTRTPLVPTGAGTGPSPVGGAGSLDTPSKTPAPKAGNHPPAAAPVPATAPAPAAAKGNGK